MLSRSNLWKALAKHAHRAAEKLQEESLVAKEIKEFTTIKHFGDPPHYSNGVAGSLSEHTARGTSFVKTSRRLLKPICRQGPGYRGHLPV